MQKHCTHLNQIKDIEPTTDGCEECIASGDTWVNLRMCLICGHVGCCNSSKNKHASKHYLKTTHALMKSVMPGESFVWCYADEVTIAR
jgi:uncharacterized UBP type Zn finger protein